MHKNPKISVVIPWHHNRDFLRRAIASIESQQEKPVETIVVCNGDGRAALTALQAEFDRPSIVFISVAEADANAARNAGIDHASGDYIAFLDADDEFTPDKIRIVGQVVQRRQSDVIVCSRGIRLHCTGHSWTFPRRLLEAYEPLSEYFFIEGNFLPTSAIVVPTSLAREIRFREGLKKFEDLDFLMRASAAGHQIMMLPNALFLYHDEIKNGRLSSSRDFESHISWARDSGHFNEKTFAAFGARAVAQYEFPRNFSRSIGRFYNGWTTGQLPATTVLMMALRGILPVRIREFAYIAYNRTRFLDFT